MYWEGERQNCHLTQQSCYQWDMPLTTRGFLCLVLLVRLFSSASSKVFYNMTKLTEWIVFAGLAFSIWITLLTDILPLKVSYKAKEVIWPVRSKNSVNKTVNHKKKQRLIWAWTYLTCKVNCLFFFYRCQYTHWLYLEWVNRLSIFLYWTRIISFVAHL